MKKDENKGSLDKFNFVSIDELKEMEAEKDKSLKQELEEDVLKERKEELKFSEEAIPEIEPDKEDYIDEVSKQIDEIVNSKIGNKEGEVVEVTEEFKVPSNKEKTKVNKFYFSFEQRVITSIVLILLLFTGACFSILKAINYGNELTVSYTEVATPSYKVCVKADEYNNKCLPEGMEYVSSITEQIKANFEYNVLFSEDTNYDFSYHVMAVMKIYDRKDNSKVLYENEELLIEQTKVSSADREVSLNESVAVDYNKFNDYVISYKNKYGLDVEADVRIVLFIDDISELREVASVKIPLGNDTYGVKVDGVTKVNQTVPLSGDSWSSVNTIWGVVGTLLVLVALFLLYRVTRLVFKVTTNRNKFQAKITSILRDYDRDIVIARSGYESMDNKRVVKVLNFNELLDAKRTLNKPIIYSKVNDVKSEFIVEDDDKIFKYVMKESDFM